MALTWLPGFRYYQNGQGETKQIITKCHWSLHGLWLSSKYSCGCYDDEEHCSHRYTHITEPELVNELNLLKPKIEANHSTKRMLRYEYLKHGTCFIARNQAYQFGMSSQEDYFSRAVWLFRHYDVGVWLKDFQLDEPHPVYKLSEAIKTHTNSMPYVQCLKTPDGDPVLYSIHLCFDRTLKFIDCDSKPSENRQHQDGEVTINYLSNHEGNCIIKKPDVGTKMMPLPEIGFDPTNLDAYCTPEAGPVPTPEAGPVPKK